MKKDKDKPVISPETKKLVAEQDKTDELNEQRHEQNVEAEKKERKELEESSTTTQEKWEKSQPKVNIKTKEELKKIFAAYKIQNPVKYEQKEARGEFKRQLSEAL